MANAEQQITMIPVTVTVESKFNPRQSFDQASQDDLTASIKEKGIIVPLIVRTHGDGYEIIAGARRFRAAETLGLKEIPAIVYGEEKVNDEQARELAITDNLQRQDVAPLDEAEGYFSLMKLNKMSIAGVAAKLGKPPQYIAGRLKLMDLSEKARKAMRDGEIALGHALLIARLSKADQDHIIKGLMYNPIGTVNELKESIERELFLDLSDAPWDKDDAKLVPAAGPCKLCVKRSGFNKELFSDIQKRDVCSDSLCFNLKLKAFLDIKRKELTAKKQSFVEISTEGYSDEKVDGRMVLGRGSYRSAASACPKAAVALVADGKGLGTLKKVCVGACETCNGTKQSSSSSRSTSDPQTRKARYARRMEIWENKITQATRAALLVKLVPTIAWPLKRIHLLALLREASRHNRAGIVLARTYGFAIKGDRDGFMTDIAEFDKATKGCSDRQLLQILFTIILQQEMVDDVSFQAPEDELLTELVKIHGGKSIDIAKVKAEARKTLESKKPKPPKPEMKTTKSTKPTTKKGKAK